jgi:hypothetical protein
MFLLEHKYPEKISPGTPYPGTVVHRTAHSVPIFPEPMFSGTICSGNTNAWNNISSKVSFHILPKTAALEQCPSTV